jgi:hypothetical protein
MLRSLFVVAVVIFGAPLARAQSPQPSAQHQLGSPPPNPAKSPPVAQPAPSVVQYQVQLAPQIPAPVTPPMIAMMVAPQQALYQPQQTAMYVGTPRTIVWGPGPVGLSLAWFGRQLQGFGKVHSWTINHSIFGPVAPVQPLIGPTSYLATMPAPVMQYQPVPVQQQTAYYAPPPTPLLRAVEEPPPAPAPPPQAPPKSSPQSNAGRVDHLFRLGSMFAR